ncbi:MAG: FmdE, Molybdenum formylmethanofuran dehydrogenase operon [Methanosaeta sp. PtaB.Bin087]|nr:MAG: FmdE, Molybdenum formylmethanofuran dehydrogenase operon [Methanosaeta sp. PtaB.Bin087]
MQMKTIDPENVPLRDLIVRGTEFHGHLGPFLVLGIRMGLFALRDLGSSGHKEIGATVKTGTIPPISCLVDGIQISTGCTMGKGNIETVDLGRAEATFSADGKSLTLKVKDGVMEEIKAGKYASLEEFAWEISKRRDEELFDLI